MPLLNPSWSDLGQRIARLTGIRGKFDNQFQSVVTPVAIVGDSGTASQPVMFDNPYQCGAWVNVAAVAAKFAMAGVAFDPTGPGVGGGFPAGNVGAVCIDNIVAAGAVNVLLGLYLMRNAAFNTVFSDQASLQNGRGIRLSGVQVPYQQAPGSANATPSILSFVGLNQASIPGLVPMKITEPTSASSISVVFPATPIVLYPRDILIVANETLNSPLQVSMIWREYRLAM